MRLIDADEIIKETWGVVIKDMFHMDETVDVISAIDIEKAPTVEAIPIDFLRKVAVENKNLLITVWDNIPAIIENIIKLWEKENE